jgi:hypothetical protein
LFLEHNENFYSRDGPSDACYPVYYKPFIRHRPFLTMTKMGTVAGELGNFAVGMTAGIGLSASVA